MEIGEKLYLQQIVISSEDGLPSLLRDVADYIEQNKLELWDLLIDTEPDDNDSNKIYARLILHGFVEPPKLQSSSALPLGIFTTP